MLHLPNVGAVFVRQKDPLRGRQQLLEETFQLRLHSGWVCQLLKCGANS